jgi:hypothetical protein
MDEADDAARLVCLIPFIDRLISIDWLRGMRAVDGPRRGPTGKESCCFIIIIIRYSVILLFCYLLFLRLPSHVRVEAAAKKARAGGTRMTRTSGILSLESVHIGRPVPQQGSKW